MGRSHFQNGNVAGKKGEEVAQSGGGGGSERYTICILNVFFLFLPIQ